MLIGRGVSNVNNGTRLIKFVDKKHLIIQSYTQLFFQSCDKFTQTAELVCSPTPWRAALEQSSSVEFVPCFIKRVNRYKD